MLTISRLANKNWQKVGELGALAADYQNAIDAFIRVASDPNGPYPGHYTQSFFNAILCMFAEMVGPDSLAYVFLTFKHILTTS